MARPWPLTGRDAELGEIAAALRPGRAGILLVGPAGVGKTRLVRDAAARAGADVVWALGSRAARSYPLGAFAGLVDVPPGDAAAAVGRVLDDLARRRPVVLGVDDAHWLDELSALVLHRVVVRRLAPVLVTVRDGEPAPDAVTALWKDELLPRRDLAPLDAATTASLLTRALAGPVETATAHRLAALSGGSPLFLRHLVTGEVRAGRLTPASGVWCWTGKPHVTRELAALLEHEIGALDPAVRDVVDLVALGEPLALATLAALAGASAVEDAETRGLVRAEAGPAGDVVRLVHPLYGEVRRDAMGLARARRLRGLLAARIDPDAEPLRRAVLAVESDLPLDRGLLLRSAQVALGFHDLPLAERLARAAAADGDWHARLLHASTLSWLTRGEESEEILADLAAHAPDDGLRAWVHAHRAGNLLWTLRRPDLARAVLDEAAAIPDAGPAALTVEAMTAACDAAEGEAAAALGRALALRERDLPDDLTRLVVTAAVAACAAVQGRVDLLDDVVARQGTGAAGRAIPVFGLTDWLVLGYRLHGDVGRARAVSRELVESSAQLPGPARLMGLVLAGHAALAGGDVRAAVVPLREAWAGLRPSQHEFRFRARTLLATAHALAGRADDARPLAAEVATDTHPAYALFVPDDLLARAWSAAADGAVTEACAHAVAAAGRAHAQASPAFEVLAWQVTTQLGGAPDAVGRLEALAAALGSQRAAAALAHARAWAAQDADALVAVGRDWEAVGDVVAAVDAHAQAADVHRRAGRRGSALTATTRAHELARGCGVRTPALLAAVHPLPLTAREREIVTLAARGLSNREIAERLTVSVRTAEGHLYRAGQKLGVSDRARLAGVLAEGTGPE